MRAYDLSKNTMRSRLQKAGVWDVFVVERERLKGAGHSAMEAWQLAYSFSMSPPSEPSPGSSSAPPGGVSLAPAPSSLGSSSGGDSSPVSRSDFDGKPAADARSVVQWVFDNMDLSDVSVSDCPSAGAWSLLMACRVSRDLKREFYRGIWPKLLPSRSHMEMEARFRDDGRQISIIDRVAAAARAADSANGFASDSGVGVAPLSSRS